ncbi:MAG TPA: SUMF1/EgtB/PvdO family nonheme iron enzyme [Polyangiaceae bacterium]|jgi:formylglycine-generating enzyme required for sulfatase activity|nr:SUMF1/EgtB/PvdO family nonheme iron enzyme [Polyangiaceae bacterium]
MRPSLIRLSNAGLLVAALAGCDPGNVYRDFSVDAFDIDRTEVTVQAYAACVKAGACTKPRDATFGDDYRACTWGVAGAEQHPINCVSWTEAEQYCSWQKKRLPTAPEWLLAALGTDGREYPWGSAPSTDMCTATRGGCEVGSHPHDRSPSGALDMAGSVSEWTATSEQDWYGSDNHDDIHIVLGAGSKPRVEWGHHIWNGSRDVDTEADPGIGFRCARDSTTP